MPESLQQYIEVEGPYRKAQATAFITKSIDGMPRARRKSSGLGADIRGDTSAPAVSTLEPMPTVLSPQLSPVCTLQALLGQELIVNSYSVIPKAESRGLTPSGGKHVASCADGKISPFDIPGSIRSSSPLSYCPPTSLTQLPTIPSIAPYSFPTPSRNPTPLSPLMRPEVPMRPLTMAKVPATLPLLPFTSSSFRSPASSLCSASFAHLPIIAASAHAPSSPASWSKFIPPCILAFSVLLVSISCPAHRSGTLIRRGCLRAIRIGRTKAYSKLTIYFKPAIGRSRPLSSVYNSRSPGRISKS